MYRLMVIFHIVTSCIFIIVAITLTIRSIAGWSKNLDYARKDRFLSVAFLLLLYLTLINGIIMYFFIDPSLKSSNDIELAIKKASLRFWVVEHFYFMTFVLILSQIGGIFIRKMKGNRSKFAYASFYYGTGTLITIISVTFYFLYR